MQTVPDFLFTEAKFLLYIFGFLISISLGSFYVTLCVRVLEIFYGNARRGKGFFSKLSIVFFRPSQCEACKKRLNPIELVPVLGYFFVNGKCSVCKTKIAPLYPLTEAFFGLVFLSLLFFTNNIYISLYSIFFLGHILLSMYTDWKKFSLDYENLPFIFFWGVLLNYEITGVVWNFYDFYVLFGFAAFYLIVWFLYKRGTGLGDVLFAPIFAFLAGHPFWLLFLNSSYLLALLTTYVLRDKQKPFRKIPVPMGFYFGLGSTISFIGKLVFFT
jgi:leader peptidase (prepilin peptidase) / N-methyltransferase